MKLKIQSIPRRNPDVVYQIVDNEAVLVQPNGGKVTVLNNVGSDIWQFIDGSNSIKLIVDELRSRYTMDTETLTRDILDFIEILLQKKLIAIDNE